MEKTTPDEADLRYPPWLIIMYSLTIICVMFLFMPNAIPSRPFPHPKYPSFQFEFESASFISLDDVIGPNLNAKLNITFIATSPNTTYNISFDTIVATLDYHVTVLVSNRLAPLFLQLNGTSNTLPIQINLVKQYAGNNTVADRAQGSIEFGLRFFTQFSTTVDKNIIMIFDCKRLNFAFESKNATFAYGTCLSNPSLVFKY